MGKCGDENSKPYVFTLDELADLNIDDTKQMNRGCGPNVEGTQGGSRYDWLKKRGWGWPENGEFEYAGGGDGCGLCSDIGDGYGCECSGGNAIGGSRGKIKRKAFLADKKDCCLANYSARNSAKTINGKTCDMKYRDPSSSECTVVFKEYCSQGDNIINDAKCKDLVNTNGTLYNQIMTTYCNANNINAKKDACINWCQSNSTSCTKLNTLNDCEKYGISLSDCTAQKASEFKTKCKKYGMLSEQGMPIGAYQCTEDGIRGFESDCNLYNLSLDECTASGIDSAKIAEQYEKQATEAMEQSRQQYEETQRALNLVLSLPEANLPDANEQDTTEEEKTAEIKSKLRPKTPSNNNILIYIAIAILILMCLSSVSSSLMIMMRNKK